MLFAVAFIACALASAAPVEDAEAAWPQSALPYWRKPFVSSFALQGRIRTSALVAGAKTLETIAYSTPARNRLMGTKGHNDTVTYLYNQLTALNYYNVTLQPWQGLIQLSGTAALFVNTWNISTIVAQFSPSGNISAPLTAVANLGCNATDYPPAVRGNIALVSRGSCTFASKSALAGAAGAQGAVIYNNIPGGIPGMTLGTEPSPFGPTVPTLGISRENGTDLVSRLASGPVVGNLYVKTDIANATTYNVLAETEHGDDENVLVLGAHSDSVDAGPGINDNGSGSIGILEVAKQLAAFRVRNSVRFAWWSGEEEGLLGSTYYVEHLSEEERAKIRLYLNFDMIASPNYIYGIFDGDGSSFNQSGPTGSADIQSFFQRFFKWRRLNHTAIPFNGRSDYAPFTAAGIPAGGIETGAEEIKTPAQAAQFGGQAGIALDANYHGPGDNFTNLALVPFTVNARAIAHGVATFARSFAGIHFNTTDDDDDDDEKRRHVRRTPVINYGGRIARARDVPARQYVV
ncbi:putative aminopeptidase Y [Trichodelitschia bisporula]|uniref:Peptide hydrolase n=1 Tax=Trichodelitschia bisporula TaxID=703511 RepID=A0A6G1HJ84_9PEZI|nr:putative aminopeptidase Y [Trichodelitschia bisporula]